MDYMEFIARKQKKCVECGFNVELEDLNPHLFDWQKLTVRWALKKGRAALFEACGGGKTGQQLEWANWVQKFTRKPVLILAPLAVSMQTKREGEKFGIPSKIVENARDIINGINITNYEKLDKFDVSMFSGVVLDESSILKSYMGKVKRDILEQFKNTPYKLSCSATPAPNDLMELLNQAEFLNVMKSSEALACWFIADQTNSGHYKLKGHATKDFWRWVAGWAICMDKPSDIGFSDTGYELPPLNEMDIVVGRKNGITDISEITEHSTMNATTFHKEKRLTINERCEKCAEIVAEANEQVIVWCYQNDEADVLKRLIPDSVEIRGSDSSNKKEQVAIDFANGNIKVLISKPTIFGYGMNFQNCHKMIFCGLDFSFESYYQAVRRIYRFGQEHPVDIYRVIGKDEYSILETVLRKERQKQMMSSSMALAMKEVQIESLHDRKFTIRYDNSKTEMPTWLRSEEV